MNGRWVVVYAAVLHVVWAVILLSFPPVKTTAIDWVLRMFGGNAMATSGVLILSAIMAIVALRMKTQPGGSFMLLLLQQFLLVVSAVGAIAAMVNGRFADGVLRPPEFIIADQASVVLLALMHAAALLERYAWRPYATMKMRPARSTQAGQASE